MRTLSVRFAASALLLVIAIALGGGSAPFADMLVEIAGIALLIVVVALPGDQLAVKDRGLAIVLLALIAIVPILQLIPLPPSLWSGLPGRAPFAAIGHLAGQDALWRPLSLDPEMTRAAALSLIPAMAMFLATLDADRTERRILATIVIGGAIVSAAVGVAQIATGSQALYPYSLAHFGNPVGLFANRNHEADLLLVAMMLTVGVAYRQWGSLNGRLGALGILFFLGITIITTRSRTGIVLAVLLMPILALFVVRPKRIRWAYVLGGIGIVAVGVAALLTNGTVQSALGRFSLLGEEARFGFWQGTAFALAQYWPVGSGLGTFVPVYASVEPLDSMQFSFVNHAHEDYLELLLETGLAAVIILPLALFVGGRQLMRAIDPKYRMSRFLAGFGMLALLLHSLVDYPLRNQSLMVVFAMLAAMLFAPAEEYRSRSADPVSKRTIGGGNHI